MKYGYKLRISGETLSNIGEKQGQGRCKMGSDCEQQSFLKANKF